jgi:uncharacterized repeat protein (TIGR01451 family)
VALNSVTVAESVPGGTWSNAQGFTLPGATGGILKADSFTLTTLPAGASYTVNYTVNAGQATGTLVNKVSAASADGVGDEDTNSGISVGILDIEKALAQGQASVVNKGEDVIYTITIKNLSGTVDLSSVTVSELTTGGTWSNANGFTLPNADTNGALKADSFTLTTLPAGASYTVNYTVNAGQTTGTLTNKVTVASTDGVGDEDTNSGISVGILDIEKALAQGQKPVVNKGEDVVYTITIKNLSSTTALNSVTVAELISGGTWSNASGFTLPNADTNGTLKADSFTLATLPAGANYTVNYTVNAGQTTGTLVNKVTIESVDGGSDVDIDDGINVGILDIKKTLAQGQSSVVNKGEDVIYTITIKNLSGTLDLPSVTVTELVPGGTWSNASGFALPNADTNGTLKADSFTLATLPAGANYTVNYTVNAGQNVGTLANTVTVVSTDGGSDEDTNTDVNVGILSIEKAPAQGQSLVVKDGDDVTYTITINNLSNGSHAVDLTDVRVTEFLAGTWSNAKGFDLNTAKQADGSLLIASIPAGGSYQVDYTVKAEPGTITNKVVAESDGATDEATDTSVNAGILDISKVPATGQHLVVNTGDEVTYTITVKNLSNTIDLTDVEIAESLLGTWSNAQGFKLPGADSNGKLGAQNFTIPTLPKGAVWTVDYTVVATAGTIVNTVEAQSGGFDDKDTDDSVNAGILDIEKVPAAGQKLKVSASDKVTYTITIKNASTTVALKDVLVVESIQGGTWSNATGFTLPGAGTDGTLKADNFVISDLPAGAVWTVDYTVVAIGGRLNNTVIASSSGGHDTDTNSDVFANGLDISKAPKAGQPLFVNKDAYVTYTITINNLSPLGTLSLANVLITDDIPGGTWSNAQGFTLPGATGGVLKADSFVLGMLPAGFVYTVDYTVQVPQGSTTVVNTATGRNDNGNGEHFGTDTDSRIIAGALDIKKEVAAGQALVVNKGDEVTYTITIKNLSDAAALSSVVVGESMLGGTWSNAQGFTLPGATGGTLKADSFTLPTLPTKAEYTVDYTVSTGQATGTLVNKVTALSTEGCSDEDTNSDINVGILGIDKDLAQGQLPVVNKGDNVTYTITIENLSANVDLSNVTVSELKAGGTWSQASGFTLPNADQNGNLTADSFTLATLPAGASWTVNYTVNVGQITGTFTNKVTVTSTDGGGDEAENSEINVGILDIEKALGATQSSVVNKGDSVTYTITIKNLSATVDLSSVVVNELLKGGTWSNAQGFALPGADQNGNLKADSFTLATLPANASYTVDYTVNAGQTTGTLANKVTVISGGGGGDEDENTDASVGILKIQKEPAKGQALIVNEGAQVTYTITVKNLSAAKALKDVVVTEKLAGTWSNAQGFDLASALQANNTLRIPELPANSTFTVDFTTTAKKGQLINEVTVSSDGGSDSATDDSVISVTPAQPPAPPAPAPPAPPAPPTTILNVLNPPNTTVVTVTEAAPAPALPGVENSAPPTFIGTDAPPLHGSDEQKPTWALLNLLAAIATVVLVLLRAIVVIVRWRETRQEDEPERDAELTSATGAEASQAVGSTSTDEQQENTGRKKSPVVIVSRILMGLLAIGSVVFFFLTEDMGLSMAFVDKWTIWMLVILFVAVAVAIVEYYLSRRNENDDTYDDEYDDPDTLQGDGRHFLSTSQ